MYIGKIVKSDSHINYVCQIYGPREVEVEPDPSDYAFGRFVRVAVRSGPSDDPNTQLDLALGKSQEPITYAVGVIYDTILLNPAFGSLGPRLSNETQVNSSPPTTSRKRPCSSTSWSSAWSSSAQRPRAMPKSSPPCTASPCSRSNSAARSRQWTTKRCAPSISSAIPCAPASMARRNTCTWAISRTSSPSATACCPWSPFASSTS